MISSSVVSHSLTMFVLLFRSGTFRVDYDFDIAIWRSLIVLGVIRIRSRGASSRQYSVMIEIASKMDLLCVVTLLWLCALSSFLCCAR